MTINLDLGNGFNYFVNSLFFKVNPYFLIICGGFLLVASFLISVIYEEAFASKRPYSDKHNFVFAGIFFFGLLVMISCWSISFSFKDPVQNAYQKVPYLNFANVEMTRKHNSTEDLDFGHQLNVIQIKGTSLKIAKIDWTKPDQVQIRPLNKVGQSYLTVAKFLTDHHVQQKDLIFNIKANETVAEYQDANGWAKVKATNDHPQKIIFQQQKNLQMIENSL